MEFSPGQTTPDPVGCVWRLVQSLILHRFVNFRLLVINLVLFIQIQKKSKDCFDRRTEKFDYLHDSYKCK